MKLNQVHVLSFPFLKCLIFSFHINCYHSTCESVDFGILLAVAF